MKLLFDRFHRIPRSLPSPQLSTVAAGRDLLAYILDRNAALLPAYFAYDEICRHYPDKTRPPHWLLQEAIAPLHMSMKTLADLVNRCLPFSNCYINYNVCILPPLPTYGRFQVWYYLTSDQY